MAFTEYHRGFEDLTVGQEWLSGGRTVTEADIVTYAGFSGDFNPIHMDAEFAAGTPFRQRIAHGFAVFCMASGLGLHSPPMRTLALIGVRDWSFVKPVMIGDTIRVKSVVKELIPKGRGRRGEVVWQRAIINQRDEVVQQGVMLTLVETRSA
jgi:3-hydroxybutyryl-CoA dehydratase